MPIPVNDIMPENKSAKERVYEVLRKWIIEGQLVPSEKIIDSDIASYFSVSRTPVREAIQLLEQQKLVVSYPGKSTIVTEIDKDDISQWYIPMLNLQKLAIKIAVEKITGADIKRLEQLNGIFCEKISFQAPTIELLYADKAFHDAILEVAGNTYIIDFCETLWIHTLRLEYAFFRDTSTLDESILHHQEMLSAFRMKDQLSAEIAMEKNWSVTAITIQNIIDNERM